MKHSIFLCFLRAFGKFSCEIRIKTGFLLFGSMRGVCLYFVAHCAFVPTRTVLAKCFSAYLLVCVACSAVFARFDWLDHRLELPAGVLFFLGSAFRPFESVSCHLTEQLRATAGADVCWSCRTMFFCLQLSLFVLLCMACSAPQLPRLVSLVGSFLGFELAIR